MNSLRKTNRSHAQETELIHVWVPKKKLRRPFALKWGLAALALFVVFAVITQLQFKKISDDKLYDTKMALYESDLVAYTTSLESFEQCKERIVARATVRDLFDGTATLIESVGGPTIADDVQDKIRTPLITDFPMLLLDDCPKIPSHKPTKPNR